VSRGSFDPELLPGNIEHFAQVPIGIAGPLLVDGEDAQGEFYVPLATTEGTLVASYNRGMKMLREAGGVTTTILIKEASEIDAAEDELYRNARGDELLEHRQTGEGPRGHRAASGSIYGSSDTHDSPGERRHQRRYHLGRQPLRDIHDDQRQSEPTATPRLLSTPKRRPTGCCRTGLQPLRRAPLGIPRFLPTAGVWWAKSATNPAYSDTIALTRPLMSLAS